MAIAKHLTAGLALVAMVFAADTDRMTRPKLDDPGIDLVVAIERKDNSIIRATLINNGDLPYRILKTNTFLDQSPVDKVTITRISDDYKKSSSPKFTGIRKMVHTGKLGGKDFIKIPPRRIKVVEINLAELYDLSAGGSYAIEMFGALSVSEDKGNKVAGTVLYTSNELILDHVKEKDAVDAADKHEARFKKEVSKRAYACEEKENQAIIDTLWSTEFRTLAAQGVATKGPADLLEEYFGSSSVATRSAVASTFIKMAQQCQKDEDLSSVFRCSKKYRDCSSNTVAFTKPDSNTITYCPLFFKLQETEEGCANVKDKKGKFSVLVDQVGSTIQQLAHLDGIRSARDFAYGYEASAKLKTGDAVLNADSYANFAAAVAEQCRPYKS